MENNKRQERLKKLFATHPTVNTFFLSSDDQAFYEKNDAENHAKNLADKTVSVCTRQMISDKEVSLKQNTPEEALVKATLKYKDVFGEDPAPELSVEEIAAAVAEKQKADKAAERDALIARYAELIGKAPAKNIGMDKLKDAIEKAEQKGENK